MKKFFILLVLALTALTVPAAEQRIATVRMDELFRQYNRTMVVESELKAQAQIYQDYIKTETAKIDKMRQDYKQARDNSQNFAYAVPERNAAKKRAEELASELQTAERDLNEYLNTAKNNMQKRQTELQQQVIAEIRQAVKTIAQQQKYSLVLDAAGQLPVVIYSDASVDLTAAVIALLNRQK